ncbi:MAG: hypothetical protein H7281_14255 [Bacteriovorax sp.]|nr:hypothetical protein [Bacteriovorax sp.]
MKIKNSLNVLIISSFILALSSFNSAFAKIEDLTFKMASNRLLAFQIIRAPKDTLPTFLFLPGVNRSLLADDKALQILSRQGFGIVTMNFSTQPFSVSRLEKSIKPSFVGTTYKLEDLATEVSALSDELKKNFGVKTIIPVSISFSGAVSSTMQNAPLIIDAVPMTSSAAVNPDLEAYRTYLKSMEIFNPIFGPALTRSLLDQAYYKKWNDQVDSITKQFNLNSDRDSDMVEGYTVLSRASEGFVWDTKNTAAQTRRIFIFARNDSALLLKDQLSVFLKVLETTPNALAFIVNDSGHVVPTEQPEAYANILMYLVSADTKAVSGIFEVQPGTDKPKFYKGNEAKQYVTNLINSL